LLGPGPHFIKKDLLGCGITKVEKHWCKDVNIRGDKGFSPSRGDIQFLFIDCVTPVLFIDATY
jgi:hypothetical protein